QAVTFTAAVKGGPGGGPTGGTVTFLDGTTVLATVPLTGTHGHAQATFTTAALAIGTHSITARYSGDYNYSARYSAGAPTSVQAGVPASGLHLLRGVAVDWMGDVLIADTYNNRVVEVKPDGTQTTVGSGLNSPHAVAAYGAGNIFIADTGNNRVVEIKRDGTQ